MDRLEPCPFCGGEPRVREFVRATEIACCSKCPVRPRLRIVSEDFKTSTHEQAISAWNRRSPDTEALAEALEALLERYLIMGCGEGIEAIKAKHALSLYRKKESPDGN